MKHLLLISAIAILARYVESGEKCKGLAVRGKFHNEEVLAKGLNRPYQLSYYHQTHEIYFSNNMGEDNKDEFEIQMLLQNRSVISIYEVANGFATAIDKENGIGYLGGSDGVYEIDIEEKSYLRKIIQNHNIWDMFFKRHLYFVTYPSQKLYKYGYRSVIHKDYTINTNIEPEHQKWIHEKIYQFAIDGDDDTFITNKTGLYMIKNGTEHRHFFEGETVFRAIVVNNKGEAHFAGRNGIYVPIKHNRTLHKIAHVQNIFGLAFDNDGHMIYSNPHQIVKLVPSVCNVVSIFKNYVPVPINT